jgi:hypothetical protein
MQTKTIFCLKILNKTYRKLHKRLLRSILLNVKELKLDLSPMHATIETKFNFQIKPRSMITCKKVKEKR